MQGSTIARFIDFTRQTSPPMSVRVPQYRRGCHLCRLRRAYLGVAVYETYLCREYRLQAVPSDWLVPFLMTAYCRFWLY